MSGAIVGETSPSVTLRRSNRRAICLVLCTGLQLVVALASVSAVAQQRPHTVLVIEANNPNTAYFREVNSAFNAAIAAVSANTVYVYVEFLTFRDFQGPRYVELLRNFFREKYRDKPIGAIVAYNSLALSNAVQWRDEVWPGVPVIFAGVDDKFAAQLNLPPNVTGFTVRHRLGDMVDIAAKLVPALKEIVLVGDRLGTKGYWEFFAEEVPEIAKHFTVVDLTGLPMAELRERVAGLPASAAIVNLGLFTDGAGVSFTPNAALQLISEVANRPIIIDTETFIEAGGVGGPVIRLKRIGEDAAQLAWRIINGTDVSSIPIANADIIRPLFDWRQLQRFAIDESRLPTGSEIRFRPPTAWEQYRWQIVLVAMALLVQTLLIVGLIYEHRRRHNAELESRRRMGELAHMNRSAAIGEMSASIAHEINQPLAGIVMNVGSALRFLGRAPPELEGVRSVLSMILRDGNRASQIISTVRAMFKKDIQDKVPIRINEPVREILALLRSELDERKVSVNLVLAEGLPQIVGNRIQLQQVIMNLVRNAAEAMNGNVVGARTLRIRSEADEPGDVVLTIEDSGPGIDAKNLDRIFEPFFTTKPDGMGMGLSICRSIVEAHGGRLTAAQAKTHGMTFQIVLPHGPVK